MRSPGVLEVVRERLRCAHGAPRRRRMHRAGSPIVQKSRRGARQARIPPISPPPVPRPAPCAPPPLRLPRVPDRRPALPEVPPVVLACESSALAGAAGGDRASGMSAFAAAGTVPGIAADRPPGPGAHPRAAAGRQADAGSLPTTAMPPLSGARMSGHSSCQSESPGSPAPFPAAARTTPGDRVPGAAQPPPARSCRTVGCRMVKEFHCSEQQLRGDESREPAISLPEHMSVPPGEGRAPPPWN